MSSIFPALVVSSLPRKSKTENYTAVKLLEHLASGKFTSVAVTTAFCKRAAIAQQLVSCLTEVFFEEALARAKYCDEYLAKEGKTLGPFHGLPISLKDSFNIKGISSTIGYTSFIAKGPDSTDSPLVSILLSKGAVLYVKTNIPQTMTRF
ncbi:amidase signature domain-containing protein [Cadophora sp. MPI-SDFR-AT-0126]|nr:amidase signature domain-containing protein [Leotiomycetes sp. MPI-SDFR-AT-0126]